MSRGPDDVVRGGWLDLPQMLYQTEYLWLVFFSSLDVILTWLILQVGGSEINPVAALLIDAESKHMLPATLFKFALVLLAVILCETVGRLEDRRGRWLSRMLVAISAFPVVWSLTLLFVHRMSLATGFGPELVLLP